MFEIEKRGDVAFVVPTAEFGAENDAEAKAVGPNEPFSIEKLSPVLAVAAEEYEGAAPSTASG